MNWIKETLKHEKVSTLLGFLTGFLCIFTAISCVSYILTWKRDQSLLSAPSILPVSVEIENTGGGFGYLFAEFLVGSCFGLAFVLLCAVLMVISFKLLTHRKVDWLRAAVTGVAGTVVTGLLLASIASFFGDTFSNAFGGGIGGRASAYVVAALNHTIGSAPTLILIIILIITICYLFFDLSAINSRLHSAFSKLFSHKKNADVRTVEEDPEPFEEEITEYVVGDDNAYEDDVKDDSATESVPNPAIPDYSSIQQPVSQQEDVQGDGQLTVNITGPEEELSTEIQEELPELDIRSDVNRYSFPPPLDLLLDYADKRFTLSKEEVERNVIKIKTTLASFKIPIESISSSVGYTVTLYKITLGEGARVNQIKNLEEDIAIKIGIKGVRIVTLADAVGIEVPNDVPSVVPLKAILNSDAFRNIKAELPIALGYTITTKAKVFDLADAPHLLVAGATKQGKSVGLNAIIASLLYSKHPTELKFVFVDPKMVEFQQYSKLFKHYLAVLPSEDGDDDEKKNAIVKDPKNAERVLRSLCVEMDERYKLLSEAGVNKITDYNEKFRNRHLRPNLGHHFLPYLVVVIDEYADLTKSTFGGDRNLSRSIENSIIRLAAKGRAAGLHVIIATQRPSVDVITGTIKSNFPTRLAFRTASRQDSMTILGITGAEKLIGKGDMLFFTGADAERVQCALIGTPEIDKLTDFVASQTGFRQSCTTPYYLPDPGDNTDGSDSGSEGGLVDMKNIDPLFEDAARLAVMNRSLSTSMIQRKMQLGFARAGRIMDQLESAGIVGPQQGSKPREALVPDLASLQPILDAFIK